MVDDGWAAPDESSGEDCVSEPAVSRRATVPCEWLLLPRGGALIATAHEQYRIGSTISTPWSHPMTGPGSVETTRHLLDAATMAAWHEHGPPHAESHASTAFAPPMDPVEWAHRLVGQYHTTHATPRTMLAASRRFEREGQHELACWAEQKAREERGHDVLALRDLTSLGYDAEALVEAIVPEGAASLVAYFEGCLDDPSPIRCVGYSYALERLALELDARYIGHVQDSLPPGVDATRCLRVHSSLGADRQHVDDTVELVATLCADARTRIAIAAYETASLCGRARAHEPALAQIRQRLLPFTHPTAPSTTISRES